MREVALAEAKNGLSALIQEVEETGAEIVITRHGKPAARLVSIAKAALSPEERRAIWDKLAENMEARAIAHPETATPLSWEAFKADLEENR